MTALLDFARPRLARSSPWVLAAFVFAVGAALYARTLGYEFVDWDDPAHLSASWFLVDHALWEQSPLGYHLHSVLLNALNGALVFWLLARITRRPLVAFVAALLFAVHSSHLEAVAWVSARTDLLFTSFLLVSAIAYHAARGSGALRLGPYLASLAAFGLGGAADPAIEATRAQPESRSDQTRALYVRGMALVRGNRFDEAAAVWNRVLERDPAYQPARAALATLEQARAEAAGEPHEAAPAPRDEPANDR